MNRLALMSLLVAGWLLAAWPAHAADQSAFSPAQVEFFEQSVRPILARRCFQCHGEKKQESGLRLDSRAAVLKGGDVGGPAVVPGEVEKSLLVAAVRRTGDFEMPPDAKLPPEEIDVLAKWIELGLPWSADSAPPTVLTMSQRMQRDRANHWAYQPIRRPPSPPINEPDWIAAPVDAFVLARLEAAGLRPSPAADRRTLIRRATFDLLGLPPTPDEVMAFVDDSSPDAYPRLIERLLASPHYGERWGRHWLDVARYADTRGYAFGQERQFPYAYTYRDYVIAAFNGDVPFDRFVMAQLAADQLDVADNDPRLAAMGFLTVGRRFNNQPDDIDDRIDVVCRGLMGLTVGCARCHDHKYDAIPTDDYYSLYGVFASSHEPDDLPLVGRAEDTPGYAAFKDELDKRQRELDQFAKNQRDAIVDTSRRRVTEYLVRVASQQPEELLTKLPFISLSPDELRPDLVQRWRRYLEQQAHPTHPVWGPWSELAALPDDASYAAHAAPIVAKWREAPNGQLNRLVQAALIESPPTSRIDLARLYAKLFEDVYAKWQDIGGNGESLEQLSPPQQQLAHILLDEDTPTSVPVGEILNYLNRDERNKYRELQKKIDSHQVNSPGAPPHAMVLVDNASPHDPRVFIRGNHARLGQPVPRQFVGLLAGESRQPFRQGSGRLELAQAIVADENPLTARVIVNRVWLHHFGQPLVATPSDFGVRSDPPTHPQVLDYLARSLIDGGWSLKDLHRAIMLSSTYRQASDDRSDGRLADPENRLLWRMNRRRLEFEPLRDSLLAVAGQLDTTIGGKPVDLLSEPFDRRRAVYGMIDRQDLPNLLRTFDFASPDQSAADRPQTSVPQQALFMMNSPFVVQQAQAIAARADVAGETASNRIVALYRLLFAREPAEAEVEIAERFISSAQHDSAKSLLAPWEQYSQLLLLTNEFMYVD